GTRLRLEAKSGMRKVGTIRFFFQAEDGIRDKLVTGVQTCALPICRTCKYGPVELKSLSSPNRAVFYTSGRTSNEAAFLYQLFVRSEERRVGKEGRCRRAASTHNMKKRQIRRDDVRSDPIRAGPATT